MRVHQFVFRSITGVNMPLGRWNGQPLLLVNTASECGYTPQYQGLEALWREYKQSGLVVIGLPCNDFGEQEPGEESAIASFCTERFNVTFPMTEKVHVSGRHAHPLFKAMREKYTAEVLPKWNFTKYLFSREGDLLQHWPAAVEPADIVLKNAIEKNLGGWTI